MENEMRDQELRIEALQQAVACKAPIPDLKAIADCAQVFYEFLSNKSAKVV
jgi:hypothetical protein